MQLVEMADAIDRLVAEEGWQIVVDQMDAELADLDGKLDGATPLEHVEYAHLHGQRRGILAAREVVQTILSKRDRWLKEQRAKHEGADAPER